MFKEERKKKKNKKKEKEGVGVCGGSVEDTRERVEGWCNEPGRVCVLVFLFWFVCDLTHTHT